MRHGPGFAAGSLQRGSNVLPILLPLLHPGCQRNCGCVCPCAKQVVAAPKTYPDVARGPGR